MAPRASGRSEAALVAGDRSVTTAPEAGPAIPGIQPELWHRIERLCAATLRLNAEHDLEKVLQLIVDSAREVTGGQYAALGVLDASDGSLANFVTSGMSDALRARIGSPPTGRGVLGVLMRHPHPLRLVDLTQDPRAVGFPDHHPPMRSFLGVPITGRGGVIGNLYLTEKAPGPEFTAEDEEMVVMLAAHAAVAVENARLFQIHERLLTDLRALQVARDRFFAMINHELRNAITAVYGWTDVWLRQHHEKPPRAALEVRETAERAVNLLEDLLDLSRLDAAKLKVITEPCDAEELIRDAIRALEPAAAAKSVRIVIADVSAPLPCQTDPKRVRQILINLLSNAVRHSPPGEVVIIEVRRSDTALRIDVVDRGDGIAADQLGSIFDAFERAGRETDRGTGLGLTLSRHLARLLNGDLRAESRPGHGARFILQLPLEACQQ